MKALKEALLEHSPQMLRAIAEMNKLDMPEGGSRDQWASHLAVELARPEVVQRAWESLSESEHQILAKMMLNGGRAKAFQLVRDYGEIRAFGPVALARDRPWLAPANPVERLWYLGLIQRAFDVVGEYRGEIFFIPEEILIHLPKPTVDTTGFAVKTVSAPQSVIDHADALMWDVFTLMAFVMREEPAVDDEGMLRAEDLRKLDSEFVIQESFKGKDMTSAPRLSLIVRIARTARLVRPVSGVGLRIGPQAKNWLRASPQSRRLELLEAWKRERTWNELRYVPSLKLEETGWRNDPRLAREAVLTYLTQCAVGPWISIPSFIAGIKKLDPDFQRLDGDYDRWHIRDADTGKLLTGFSHWNQVEGALVSYLFEGPLLWLGIVSMGAAAGEPRAFRITDFGARALGLSETDLPEPVPQRFIAQGDFDVLVPQEAPLYARFQLERMADRVQFDRVSTYHLSRDSLIRLLHHHVTIDQILTFLKRISREPFPKNVEVTLREWAAKYGEITLRRAAILHTRDQNLLKELQHLPDLQPYILEVLSPTVALVAPDRLEEMHTRLQALGYSPRIEEPTKDQHA